MWLCADWQFDSFRFPFTDDYRCYEYFNTSNIIRETWESSKSRLHSGLCFKYVGTRRGFVCDVSKGLKDEAFCWPTLDWNLAFSLIGRDPSRRHRQTPPDRAQHEDQLTLSYFRSWLQLSTRVLWTHGGALERSWCSANLREIKRVSTDWLREIVSETFRLLKRNDF